MQIAIIGSGYVGLVTGACLAYKGHQVICIDKKQEVVEAINNRQSPIYEPGLERILKQVVAAGNLKASQDLKSAVRSSAVTFIAVGTPFAAGQIDLRYVEEAAGEIGAALKGLDKYHVVCVKSTVVPTTTDKVVGDILTRAVGNSDCFGLAMNPEFLREGKAVVDFLEPDRIVIGANDDRSFRTMHAVYADYFSAPIIRVNLRTAEMIKYTANALLATMISFANEIALICEATGETDVQEVMNGVTLDKRLQPKLGTQLIHPEFLNYLQAGCGFGGSCFPKDVRALTAYAEGLGYPARMLEATMEINDCQPLKLLSRLEIELGTLSGKKVAVLGLAFKPDTDDIRESPSITIIRQLVQKGASVHGVDPIACTNMKRIIPEASDVKYSDDYRYALQDADAAFLVTAWPEFVSIPPTDFKRLMRSPVVLDGRRVFNAASLEQAGCKYLGVGLT